MSLTAVGNHRMPTFWYRDTISLIGTTSTHIDYNEIDSNRVTACADILLREGKTGLVMAKTRILRAYSGVRPLVASDDDPPAVVTSAAVLCCSTSR